MHKFKNL